MRSNARAVCLGLLILLVAVAGFWAWVLILKPRKLDAPIAAAPAERERITLGILDILHREAAEPPSAPKVSPFYTRYSPPVPVPAYTNISITPRPPAPKPHQQTPLSTPPPTPPPPETTTVTFRGAMERPDGVVLAMFEVKNSKGRRTSFARQNETLFGMKVDAISTTGTVAMVRADGTTNLMSVGRTEQFTEGH